MIIRNRKSFVTSKLYRDLKLLHNELRKKTNDEWNRILPFEELLFDRWEKAKFVKAKKDSSIYHNSYIFGRVSIGKNTWVGPYTLLDGSGGRLRIGHFCSISSGVQIFTHNTVKWALTGGKAPKEKRGVTVGDFCYLGPYTIVTMGTRIGKCSVVGAHSLVNSNIPPYSIAFGIPAKVVGKVYVKGRKVKYNYFDVDK
ncbi:MAG: acyltransferase [Nitrosopumilaceae archaeon]